MLRYARLPAVRRYPVEVSGWDAAGNFFVENRDLFWSEDSGKHVLLNRKLSRNAILFVRLLDSDQAARAHPVVYEAEWVGESPDGASRFRLNTVTPRVRLEESQPA